MTSSKVVPLFKSVSAVPQKGASDNRWNQGLKITSVTPRAEVKATAADPSATPADAVAVTETSQTIKTETKKTTTRKSTPRKKGGSGGGKGGDGGGTFTEIFKSSQIKGLAIVAGILITLLLLVLIVQKIGYSQIKDINQQSTSPETLSGLKELATLANLTRQQDTPQQNAPAVSQGMATAKAESAPTASVCNLKTDKYLLLGANQECSITTDKPININYPDGASWKQTSCVGEEVFSPDGNKGADNQRSKLNFERGFKECGSVTIRALKDHINIKTFN